VGIGEGNEVAGLVVFKGSAKMLGKDVCISVNEHLVIIGV
jgi:hypothetical protein